MSASNSPRSRWAKDTADSVGPRLQEAFAAVHEARQARESNFNDAAGDALNLCRRAFRLAVEKAPETLDTAQTPNEKIQVLKFLLKVQENKAIRKNQVKCSFGLLFTRDAWLYAAGQDGETKTKILAFMSAFSDMNKLANKLEMQLFEATPAPENDFMDDSLPGSRQTSANSGASNNEEISDGVTRRLVQLGLEGFRECNFVYPTGPMCGQASDDALEAFASNFLLGVSRIVTSNKTRKVKSRDPTEHELLLQEIPTEDMPNILDFLVTLWEGRGAYRNKVTYCVGKLQEVSIRFEKVVAARTGLDNRLPWLPSLSMYGSIDTEQPKSMLLQARRKYNPGLVCTVVWIDSNRNAQKAYLNSKALLHAGYNVKGFLDDSSRGPSNAGQNAESYLVDALANPQEIVVAIIVNSGPSHKQMLKNLLSWNFRNGRPAPLCMARTSHGTYADFADCGVTLVTKARAVVEAVVVEEMKALRAGGHFFQKGQQVVVFSESQRGWIKAEVHDIEWDGKVVVSYGESRKSIPPHDFGVCLRAPSSDSIFWEIARDPPASPGRSIPRVGQAPSSEQARAEQARTAQTLRCQNFSQDCSVQ